MSYFAVNIDNTRKLVCRLYFNNEDNLRVAFMDDERKEERIKIDKLDDLYNLSERLINEAKKYL